MTVLSATNRGYGYRHQARREELLPAAIGQPCPFCHFEMKLGQALELDHSDPEARKRGEPGDRITHAGCNRAGRAYYGDTVPSARTCEICGTPFASRNKETRTCSRACGTELRRRNAPPTQPKVKAATVERTCTECGQQFETRYQRKKTCSVTCSRRRMHRWKSHQRIAVVVTKQSICKECDITIMLTGHRGRPPVLCEDCRPASAYQLKT